MANGSIESDGTGRTRGDGEGDEPERTPTPFISDGDREPFVGVSDSIAEFQTGDVIAD